MPTSAPRILADPRFADEEVRRANRAELTALIQSWVMELPELEAQQVLSARMPGSA